MRNDLCISLKVCAGVGGQGKVTVQPAALLMVGVRGRVIYDPLLQSNAFKCGCDAGSAGPLT